jgi:hypothetical protein
LGGDDFGETTTSTCALLRTCPLKEWIILHYSVRDLNANVSSFPLMWR